MISRCRFVGKELSTGEAEGLLAGTPTLEPLRPLLSDVATAGITINSKVLMINDVSRALFEAPIQRSVCIELPKYKSKEDTRRDMFGHLTKSLYGERDADATFHKKKARSLWRRYAPEQADTSQIRTYMTNGS